MHLVNVSITSSQAGVIWSDAYAFADKNNVTIVGGYGGTIGASGAWVMVRRIYTSCLTTDI